MIWKVLRFVDDRIHLQQAVRATKVGYNAFYKHELAQIHGSKADREYWAQNTKEAEKDILKIKTHKKQLLGISSGTPSRNENSSANQDGSPIGGQAKTKRNKHQRHLYKKQQKARRAQQKTQNQPKANAAPAPAQIKADP